VGRALDTPNERNKLGPDSFHPLGSGRLTKSPDPPAGMTASPLRIILFSSVAAVLGVALVAALQTSYPGDPGEGLFDVKLVNDTNEEIVVQRHCAVELPRCEYTTYRDILPAGSAWVATDNRNQDQGYRAVSTHGKVVGCLPLRFATVAQGATLKLTKALVPC